VCRQGEYRREGESTGVDGGVVAFEKRYQVQFVIISFCSPDCQ